MTAPPRWTVTVVPDPALEGRHEKQRTFALRVDGRRIGTLTWVRRPRHAGGNAWRARMTGAAPGGLDAYLYAADRDEALAMARHLTETKPAEGRPT